MEIRLVPEARALASVAADLVVSWLGESEQTTVMPAVGDTPQGLYRELAHRRAHGAFDSAAIVAVQLDEYVGVGETADRSLYGWLRRSFADPLGIPEDRVVRLRGDALELDAACDSYDRRLEALGGIDIAILGLGPNGHLGFNEPPSPSEAPTRVVDLSTTSLESNAHYAVVGGGPVPRRAVTAGMPWILGARHPLLLVSGSGKRDILRRLLTEPISPTLPGSYLRLVSHAVLLADHAAWPDDVRRAPACAASLPV